MTFVPWSKLQTQTINLVIHDFGLADYTSRTARKNELVKLLQSIEKDGLPLVVERLKDERVSAYPARDDSPELEYAGPPPFSPPSPAVPVRPVVEILVPAHSPTSPVSSKLPHAGPSRIRAQTRAEAVDSSPLNRPIARTAPSTSKPPITRVGPPKPKPPITRVGPPSRKRARTGMGARPSPSPGPGANTGANPSPGGIDFSKIPLPSYAILYQQRQNISMPRPPPNTHETFVGVIIDPRRKKRPRAEEEEEEEEGGREGRAERPVVVEDVDVDSADADESEGAVGADCASSSTGGASTSASVTRAMEAIVVTPMSAKATRPRTAVSRRRVMSSDDEMDVEV